MEPKKPIKPVDDRPIPPPIYAQEQESEEEREDEVPEGVPTWYLSFSDMMTNMFVFFALLVSMGTIEQEKFRLMSESLRSAFGSEAKGSGGSHRRLEVIHGTAVVDESSVGSVDEVGALVNKEVGNIMTDVKQFVTKNKMGDKISAHTDYRGVVITISDIVLFPEGEARITSEGIKTIKQIFDMVKELDYEVKIEGHTDNTPIQTERFPSNWELASSRASDVARRLVEAGFPPEKIGVVGYAGFRPKVPNDSPEHRAMNRRIEVVFQRESIRRHMADLLQRPEE